ncbi:Uncharacterised protein [Mycobacteroides abscessus subsp. abscessus]|nr:Uncharacterised protein [Mycobacteroides abscessus subsp. abscessus]
MPVCAAFWIPPTTVLIPCVPTDISGEIKPVAICTIGPII